MALTASQQQDLDFWGRQIVEHARLLQMLAGDRSLQAELARHERTLAQTYAARDANRFMAATRDFIGFKLQVLARLRQGTWLGWAFPSLYDHMNKEESYFLARLAGPLTPAQELAFWLQERSEELGLAGHLLDPSEQAATDNLQAQSVNLAALAKAPYTPANAAIALQATAPLNRVIGAMTISNPLSVIAPQLKAHVLREGEQFQLVSASLAPLLQSDMMMAANQAEQTAHVLMAQGQGAQAAQLLAQAQQLRLAAQ